MAYLCHGFGACRNAFMDVYPINTNNHHGCRERHRYRALSSHQSIQKVTYTREESHSRCDATNDAR